MLTKGQLKSVLSENGLRPLKRLGESYLIDSNIKDKIIAEVCPAKEDSILEIGPGLGALTFDLAGSGARVVAIEKDRKVFAVLKKLTAGKFPNLELRCDDILKFKPETLTPQARFKVVGNLPYYITTPIIEYLLRQRHLFDLTVIMVQREVASRMMAKPASGDYGSFSCFVQYYAEVSYVHTVKRNSFYPMPEVDSSILRMDFARKSAATIRDEELLFRIIRGAFNQRRKSISNSLSREKVLDIPKDALTAALERIGINPQTRPQDLSLSDFARICASLADFAGMK